MYHFVMEPKLLNENIVLKKQGLVTDNISGENVSDLLVPIIDNAQPIINKFPQILIVTFPNEQFGVTIQNETVVISNDPQPDNPKRDKLVKSAIKLNDKFQENLTAYGVNFRYTVENSTLSNVQGLLDSGKLVTLGAVEDAEQTKLLSLSYIENNSNSKVQVMINIIPSSDGSSTGVVEFIINFHQDISGNVSLPNFTALKRQVVEYETKATAKIRSILG